MDCALAGPSHECPLDSPMLVAERYLQMKDILAVTLETEMAGFDDSRMHRADSDFVDLIPGHCEEIGDSRNWCWSYAVARSVGRVKSNRLQPRMPFRMN